jgi:hypothetical protein
MLEVSLLVRHSKSDSDVCTQMHALAVMFLHVKSFVMGITHGMQSSFCGTT